MALERVLNNHPDDIPARTELVRAYRFISEHGFTRGGGIGPAERPVPAAR